MNKRFTRKIFTAFAVATFFVVGAMAQTHDGTAVPGAAADYAASTAQGTTYIAEGTTVPMYALPDPYFHPNYDVATSTWTLSDDFTWTFFGTAATTLTVTQANANDNYVTVAAALGDAGSYTLSVTEDAPAAYGGCSGPQVDLAVEVVERPTFAINGGDATYAFCEGNAGFPANINTTIAGGWQNYRLAWNLTITTLYADPADGDGIINDIEFYYTDENGAGQNAALTYAVNHTTDETVDPFDAQAAASATYDIMTVADWLVIDNNGAAAGGNAVTQYTYTLVSVNDQALRYGDYITLGGVTTEAENFTYDVATAASDQVVVTVYPAPVTGPIYHITNTWAN